MHLERVLAVVEWKYAPDGSYPGFDIRHMGEPLKCAGLVDNIDVFYYHDYLPNSDEALINYCLEKKPQAVLLSLQDTTMRKEGAPTPECIGKITHQLGIPTVAFWFDIWVDKVAEVLEQYLHSVTLHMILSVDARHHKPLPLEGTNYVYAGITFDERLFDIPEGVRDIPVGILGPLYPYRRQWVTGLKRCGITPYTTGRPQGYHNLAYEDYLRLTSRMKIVLNFSALNEFSYEGITLPARQRVLDALSKPVPQLTMPYRGIRYMVKSWRDPIPALKLIISVLTNKPAPQNPHYEVRARVWEALWCRTFLLEGENPATALYFEPYADYVPFTTLKDLVDKIRYYQAHDEERDRIRLHGRATVERYHSARVYWENLFEAIGLPPEGQAYHHPGEIWDRAYFDQWYLRTGTGNIGDL